MDERQIKQDTAKQHVVPKFYLKNFTNEKMLLEVFSKKWCKFIPAKNPSAIGYDLFFYAQNTGQPDDISQEFEELLHYFEDYISSRYRSLCEKILSNTMITDEDIYTVSLHACILWLRGYGLRRQINTMNEAVIKRLLQFQAHHPDADRQIRDIVLKQNDSELTDEQVAIALDIMKSGDYNILGDNITHLMIISDYQMYTNLFMSKKLRIFIAEKDVKFITSDIPLMELLPKYAKEKSFYGWHFLERLHSFPLSSEILVEFHDPLKLSGKKVIRRRISNDDVTAANARQLCGAGEWCVGKSKEDFYTWKNPPNVTLPLVNRTGKFEENHLGMKVE